MKIFVDTANLDEIKSALDTGLVDGVITNPSLLAKEPKSKFEEHIGKIITLLYSYHQKKNARGIEVYGPKDFRHLSVEVFSDNSYEILEQAKNFSKIFSYPVSVKVQIGWEELRVIKALQKSGVVVNCTACMSVSQAVMAKKAGARYVSLFWGRIRDGSPEKIREKYAKALQERNAKDIEKFGAQLREAKELVDSGVLTKEDFDPFSVVRRTREFFDREDKERTNSEIIAGSMRSIWDVRDAMLAGAHIVIVPYKFFAELPKLVQHFKTDEVVQQFLSDFENWLK